jgi:hypothetical protein
MPFETNENNRSLTPTGNKAFPTVDVSAGTEMPPGITSMKPLRSTPTREVGPVSSAEQLSQGLKGQLGKLNPEMRQRVNDVVRRK